MDMQIHTHPQPIYNPSFFLRDLRYWPKHSTAKFEAQTDWAVFSWCVPWCEIKRHQRVASTSYKVSYKTTSKSTWGASTSSCSTNISRQHQWEKKTHRWGTNPNPAPLALTVSPNLGPHRDHIKIHHNAAIFHSYIYLYNKNYVNAYNWKLIHMRPHFFTGHEHEGDVSKACIFWLKQILRPKPNQQISWLCARHKPQKPYGEKLLESKWKILTAQW